MTIIAFICILNTISFSQTFLKKIPAHASLVIKYKGENLFKQLPLQKLNGYQFIKNNLFKVLSIDSTTKLENTGINFNVDTYQYLITADTCISFITVMDLKNEAQFVKFANSNFANAKNLPNIKKYKLISISNNTYIAWNKSEAIFINTTFKKANNYYMGPKTETSTVVDTAYVMQEQNVDTTMNTTEEANSVSTEEVTAKENAQTEKYRIEDSIYAANQNEWDAAQKIIVDTRQLFAAQNIISAHVGSRATSLENDMSYKKIIDPEAPISVWLDTENIITQYSSFLYSGIFGLATLPAYNHDKNEGYKSAVNIYFDKDKMRMENKTYSPNVAMNNLALNMMDSKQNASLTKYINADNIGYLSMSINTEATAKYYYAIMKNYLQKSSIVGEYGDLVDIYIDLMEITIDENAIAKLMTGNALMVMHDLKPKTVEYTDYEYDADFNKTEIKKTKEELSPDFTIIVETKMESFMQKLANLPVKYAEKGGYNYTNKGEYYHLSFGEKKKLITDMYFMVKDNKAIITTSLNVINHTINNTSFNLDAANTDAIMQNNYAMQLNSKRLMEKLKTLVNTEANKKISNYLINNLGDIKMQSAVKDGMVQGVTTMNIAGSHNNSLEYFFNLLDNINKIMLEGKSSDEKAVIKND